MKVLRDMVKGTLKMHFREGPWDGAVILNHRGRSSILLRGRQEGQSYDGGSRGQSDVVPGRGHEPSIGGEPLEPGKGH